MSNDSITNHNDQNNIVFGTISLLGKNVNANDCHKIQGIKALVKEMQIIKVLGIKVAKMTTKHEIGNKKDHLIKLDVMKNVWKQIQINNQHNKGVGGASIKVSYGNGVASNDSNENNEVHVDCVWCQKKVKHCHYQSQKINPGRNAWQKRKHVMNKHNDYMNLY